MAEDKKISQLNPAAAFTGAEKFELVQGGLNLAGTPEQMKTYIGGITRESGRASSTELLFDKNVIQMDTLVQTGAMTITVSEGGNLSDQESVIITKIQSNGVDPITLQYDPAPYFNNFTQGEVLPEGTYKVFILRDLNGEITFSVVKPSIEVQSLTPLAIPSSFSAVPGTDPETEMDLSWDAVSNVSSYEVYRSATGGGGPWGDAIATPAAGATTYTDTGRSPNTTYHYRIRAIGDQITFSNSQYAITAGSTEDAGDTTDPVIESSVADSSTDIVVNQVVVFTSDKALRDADGVTEITNANILDYLTGVNSSAGAQSFTATIDETKKIITITPFVVWDENDDITLTLDGVEDLNGNEPAAFAITFSTSDYTAMQGNNLSLGSLINSVITGNVNFELEFEFDGIVFDGIQRSLTQKHNSVGNQVSHLWSNVDEDVKFKFYERDGPAGFSAREITWPDALLGVTVGKITLKYDGSVNTNNGLDRPGLFIDDVEFTTGKNLSSAENGVSAWPWNIGNSTAPFLFRGPTFRKVRNLKIRNNNGATTVVDIPIIRSGIDVSGNNFHGTWS